MKENKFYVLDLNSERFRECPECLLAFMARHLSMRFDKPGCRHAYNNRKKRRAKQAGKINNDNPQILMDADLKLPFLEKKFKVKRRIKVQPTPVVNPVSEEQQKSIIRQQIRTKNIARLRELLGESQQVFTDWKTLDVPGETNFEVYDHQERLDGEGKYFKIIIGDYAIYWGRTGKLTITYRELILSTTK